MLGADLDEVECVATDPSGLTLGIDEVSEAALVIMC
jgi:hypothetical protein